MRRSSKFAMLATVIMLGACNADGPTAVPAGGPVLLNIVSGDAQRGDPGKELPKPLVVVATDEKGKPVKGQLVNFVVVSGGGRLFAGSSITDNKGQAQDYWTLGAAGAQTVEVRAVDPSTGEKHTYATFTATFAPPPDIDADGDGFLGSVDCNDAEPAIHPGATDDPDDSFIDMNCDGIDGDKATAVFVARNGLNVSTCGSMAAPCERITYGIAQAIALGRTKVFIAMGDYPETVTLVNGINLYGGYAANFSSRSFDTRATINGSAPLDGTPGQLFTMLASDLTQPTTVSALIIRGGDASAGATSHALVVRNDLAGNFRLSRTRIVAGNGGDGLNGAAGANGLSTIAGAGSNGGAAGTVGICDDGTRGTPGANGTTTAGGGNGGRGGTGGFADASCNIFSPDFSARGGQDGSNGFPSAFPFGLGGNGGLVCLAGTNGEVGRTSHGTDGVGGTGFNVVNGFVVTGVGASGSLGLNGTGGGGGGGSGGCDNGGNAFGAGGGGGGAGGQRAPTAGSGGGGGGASVGVFVINASPSLTNVEVVRGRGGNGGAGGNGGRGQSAGIGGAGGLAAGGGGPGGAGGRGGDGGNSGSGGGGAGGASVGILTVGGAVVDDSGVSYSLGTGGVGGSGGVGPVGSAPSGVAGTVASKIAK